MRPVLGTTVSKHVQNVLGSDLHSIHSAGNDIQNWHSRDECAAGHTHIECRIFGDGALAAAAEGGRELPHRTLDELRRAYSPTGAGQDCRLIQQVAVEQFVRSSHHPGCTEQEQHTITPSSTCTCTSAQNEDSQDTAVSKLSQTHREEK